MVKDFLKRQLLSVEPQDKVSDAAQLMEKENVGCVLVLDHQKPRGIITDRDIVVRCVAKNINTDDCRVQDVMTDSLTTVRDTDDLLDCIEAMKKAGVRRIPVVNEEGNGIGLISLRDILSKLSREFSEVIQATTPAIPGAEKLAA